MGVVHHQINTGNEDDRALFLRFLMDRGEGEPHRVGVPHVLSLSQGSLADLIIFLLLILDKSLNLSNPQSLYLYNAANKTFLEGNLMRSV